MRSNEELDKQENLGTELTSEEAQSFAKYIAQKRREKVVFEEIEKETKHDENCECYFCDPSV